MSWAGFLPSPTVDSREAPWPEGLCVQASERLLGFTSAVCREQGSEGCRIQRSDDVPESKYEVLVVFTASRQAETLGGICVPAWSDCVQLPQETMNVYVAGGLIPRRLSIQYVLNKDYFPVKRRLLGWAGRIRGAGGWGPGRSSNGELRRTELQDQLGQGQIFLARGGMGCVQCLVE